MQKNRKKKGIDDWTNSSIFLLPCFGISYKEFEDLGFVNCYLADKNREKVNSKDIHIYLLFKPSTELMEIEQTGGYLKLERETQHNRLSKKIEELEDLDGDRMVLLEDYDYEGGYIILVLKLPERLREDYNNFLGGKYSKLSTMMKKHYPNDKITKFKNEKGQIEQLLGKSLPLRIIERDITIKKYVEDKYDINLDDCEEYWSVPSLEKETLDIETFYQDINK